MKKSAIAIVEGITVGQGDEGGKRSRKFAYVGMKAKSKTRDSEMY